MSKAIKKTKTTKRSKAVEKRHKQRAAQRDKNKSAVNEAAERIKADIDTKKVEQAVNAELEKRFVEQRKKELDQIKNQRDALTRKTEKDYKRKRFFITAAELGAEINKQFAASIDNFLKETSSELVILPLRPHRRLGSNDVKVLDRQLVAKYQKNIHTEYVFNQKIKAVEIHLNSQQINPVTGLHRLTKQNTSIIVGHSKQQMKVLPTGHSSTPKIIHSTGVITKPTYLDNRIGRIAKQDHIVGGLVLEISGENFHIRTVKMDKDGSFVDINRRYYPNKKSKTERAEALVLGDYHCGFEDRVAEKFAFELTQATKPRRIFFHDFFDAASVSHHRDKSISQHLAVPDHLKKLTDELSYANSILKNWHEKKPKDCELFMVQSNHPEHLNRYLDEGRFFKDRMNYKKALELAYKYHCEGLDPIQEGVDPGAKLATWLPRDADMRVEGVMLSAHGDKGLNGAKGHARSTELAYGNAIVGHAHTPEILHRTYVVGTLSKLRLDYNVGPSSWLHACGLVHKGGGKQLIISIDGKWRL